MDLLAKTAPKVSLEAHTRHVMDEAERVLDQLGYGGYYKEVTGRRLADDLKTAARWHDLGKAHDRWQTCARERRLETVNLRHEMVSLRFLEDRGIEVPGPVEAAIAAHHDKLSYFYRQRWTGGDAEDFTDLWKQFTDREKEQSLDADLEDLIDTRYAHDAVRGLLRLADRRASQREAPSSPDPLPIRPFDYQFPSKWTMRPVQEAAVAVTDRRVAALRSETGSGKTAASLLWAQRQIEAGRAQRAIVALPTRFTSNSLFGDVAGDVSAGLYHSSAWQVFDDDPRGDEKLRRARQFLEPLVVTTIDQVLTCLTGRREGHHLQFTNLAHSCVIIDECDFYDEVVQANIERLGDVLGALGVPTLVMSPTLPDEHLSVYFPEGVPEDQPVDTTQGGTSFTVATIADVGDPEDADLSGLVQAGRGIIYANTVDRAKKYYEALPDTAETALYHSRFTELHKSEKERRIREMLGEDGTGGVAVMTQIGEMSLNISARVMASELCPIDRLAQRTGRLCRFACEEGTLHVFRPLKDGALYPAPYGSLQPGEGWTPAVALLQTDRFLETEKDLDKEALKSLTNQVYDQPLEYGDFADNNADALIEELRNHWLITPRSQVESDDTRSDEWVSRQIGPQIDVFVTLSPLDTPFEDSRGFEEAKTRHSISLPRYKLDQHPGDFATVEVQVEGDPHRVLTLSDPELYSEELGY